MVEIVNLRRARKSKARDAHEKAAAVNRLHHGTPKHLRDTAKAGNEKAVRAIDAHKIEPEGEG
jgi:hypothetical protein